MPKSGRYNASGFIENQFEPGSRGRVLRNLVGIKTVREIDVAEAVALKQTLRRFHRDLAPDLRFTAADVCRIHAAWLGRIYPWAGRYRRVNIATGDLAFAAAAQVPKLMTAFERGPLRDHTPCRFTDRDRVVRALAEVHVELILIHPFRDGNGRAARLLATLMASQAGLPILNFEQMTGRRRRQYFTAVRAGLDKNYRPMEEIFAGIIAAAITEDLDA